MDMYDVGLLSMILYGLVCWGIRYLPGFSGTTVLPLFITYLILALFTFYPVTQMSGAGMIGLVMMSPIAAILMVAMVNVPTKREIQKKRDMGPPAE